MARHALTGCSRTCRRKRRCTATRCCRPSSARRPPATSRLRPSRPPRQPQIGKRHGDRELMALAIHAQGHMLVLAGRVPEGLALLDEAMVIVTTHELSPFVVGIVYCGVILACQAGFEVARAREWTLELTRWVEQQPRPGGLHGPLPRPSRRDPAAGRVMVGGARGGTARGRAPRRDEELRCRARALPAGRAAAAARRIHGGRTGVSGCEPERL